ncbi:MAG: hypothetical protein JWO98_1172 [Frankiales bacterium]|nr:hypothetical protein [Frankiales bacterium]
MKRTPGPRPWVIGEDLLAAARGVPKQPVGDEVAR